MSAFRTAARVLFALLIVGLLSSVVTLAPAWGQEEPLASIPEAPSSAVSYAPVRLEGRTLFEVPAGDGLSASDRAARISRRLRGLLERPEPLTPFGPDDVRRMSDNAWEVRLGSEPILTVFPSDAADNLATSEELARVWGRDMSAALAEARTARENPIRGVGILIRNSVRDLFVSAVTLLPRLASALILALLFWLVARIAGRAVCAVADRTGLDPNLRQLGRAVAYYGAWAVGVVAILATFGFQTGGIVAALGISGFILGFAFKDILSHFLAGLMLLVGRQFRIGDQIIVKEQEGTVERIELRALHLRTYDNRLVIIPNAEVFNSIITSNTASPHRRREFVVGIGYEQDIGSALRLAQDTVAATPGVLHEPAPDVLVDSLSPSTVDLRVRFFMNSLRADYLKVGSDCMRRVKEAFEAEGVSMPTPIQTVVFANVSDAAKDVAQTLSEAGEPGNRRRRAA